MFVLAMKLSTTGISMKKVSTADIGTEEVKQQSIDDIGIREKAVYYSSITSINEGRDIGIDEMAVYCQYEGWYIDISLLFVINEMAINC